MSKERVIVALSGGVDSAAAAALLVRDGYDVVGMTMRLYDASGTRVSIGGRCCGPRDIEDARMICEHLDIPFYVVDFATTFSETVVDNFVDAYLSGETPNPCARCNQHIKFTPLLQRARSLGIDKVVTGHYAKLVDGEYGRELRRGRDNSKDQSYFLFAMPRESLEHVEFPLGGYTKKEVRAMADEFGLPVAGKKESQEICFVPDGDYAGFVSAAALKRKSEPVAGRVVNQEGEVLGKHDGIHKFTVGQRKGLGNFTGSEKQYVADIDPSSGDVTIGSKAGAARNTLSIRDVHWLGPAPSPEQVLQCQVRYRAKAVAARVSVSGHNATLHLDEAVVCSPGQAAVLYDDDRVVGGGWITRA